MTPYRRGMLPAVDTSPAEASPEAKGSGEAVVPVLLERDSHKAAPHTPEDEEEPPCLCLPQRLRELLHRRRASVAELASLLAWLFTGVSFVVTKRAFDDASPFVRAHLPLPATARAFTPTSA